MENSIEEYVEILERFSNENVIYGSTIGMTLEKYKEKCCCKYSRKSTVLYNKKTN